MAKQVILLICISIWYSQMMTSHSLGLKCLFECSKPHQKNLNCDCSALYKDQTGSITVREVELFPNISKILPLHTAHDHHHETTITPRSTTDICDYLCSIQLGGVACNCNMPGLPG